MIKFHAGFSSPDTLDGPALGLGHIDDVPAATTGPQTDRNPRHWFVLRC